MKIRWWLLVVFFISHGALAATELEREKIKQALDTLEVAKQLFREARQHSSETAPEMLLYDKLFFDLGELDAAVKRHIISPSRKPRELKDLYLDYK